MAGDAGIGGIGALDTPVPQGRWHFDPEVSRTPGHEKPSPDDTEAASDNERWNMGQAELQKQLAPGMPAADYRKKIEGLGYQVTSTNYNNADYLEYELVKGDNTWEVQIDVDDATKKAKKVDVTMG
jgi:hypothetical protein